MVSGEAVSSLIRLHTTLHMTGLGFYNQSDVIFIQPLEPCRCIMRKVL